ncbi:hypothetical protein Hanom_Chr08g00744491 [Helianthus anomalus]
MKESCQDGLKHKRITSQEKARNRIRARTHKCNAGIARMPHHGFYD